MRDPVGDDMVGLPGEKDAHIDAANDGCLERVNEYLVGDEVGRREEDTLLRLINRGDVEVANGKRHAHRLILTDSDMRVNMETMKLGYALAWQAKAIPEGNKGVGEFRRGWTAYTHVCIAPLGGIGRSDIVAPDKARHAVDDEQLAVVERIAAGIKQVPGTTQSTVFEHMNRREK